MTRLGLARRKPDRYLILSRVVLLHKKLANGGLLKQANLILSQEYIFTNIINKLNN